MTRVLLVEDEADLLALVSETLDHHGLLVTEADSGARAMEKLRNEGPFDVVVSDIAMPGDVSGIDVAQEVAANHPDVCVILTSGHPQSHFGSLPKNTQFLSKPYRVKQLVELLRATSLKW
jgi:two-component system cell cycle response regulator CpdR